MKNITKFKNKDDWLLDFLGCLTGQNSQTQDSQHRGRWRSHTFPAFLAQNRLHLKQKIKQNHHCRWPQNSGILTALTTQPWLTELAVPSWAIRQWRRPESLEIRSTSAYKKRALVKKVNSTEQATQILNPTEVYIAVEWPHWLYWPHFEPCGEEKP